MTDILKLTIALACGKFLTVNGYLTSRESQKVYERIQKIKKLQGIQISKKDIDRVNFTIFDIK